VFPEKGPQNGCGGGCSGREFASLQAIRPSGHLTKAVKGAESTDVTQGTSK